MSRHKQKNFLSSKKMIALSLIGFLNISYFFNLSQILSILKIYVFKLSILKWGFLKKEEKNRMTLNQIHYFIEIARFESYSLAAESLHISQPSLSRSMTLLEEELKIALFEKKGRGVTLSKAGSLFLEQALVIENTCVKALSTMEKVALGAGSIDLGYVFPLAKDFIPTCISQFLQESGNENISFSLYQGTSAHLMEMVQKGDLDVGFGFPLENNSSIALSTYPLFSFGLVAAFSLDHPLVNKKELFLSDLTAWPMVGYEKSSYMSQILEKTFEKHFVKPTFIALCPDEYTIFSLVRKNIGVALVLFDRDEKLNHLEGIILRQVKDIEVKLQVEMFWNAKHQQLPMVKRFLDFIQRNNS